MKDLCAREHHVGDASEVGTYKDFDEVCHDHSHALAAFRQRSVATSREVAWVRKDGIERHAHLAVCNAGGLGVDLSACEQQAKTGGLVTVAS